MFYGEEGTAVSFKVLILLLFSSVCLAMEKPYTLVADDDTPKLYILVSTGMPEQSLKNLAFSADLIGRPLTIQGFVNNSIRSTVARAKELFSEHEVGEFSIDPEIFTDFNITMVPAFVVTTKAGFDVIRGDIPLKAALEKLLAKGDEANKTYLQGLLAKL